VILTAEEKQQSLASIWKVIGSDSFDICDMRVEAPQRVSLNEDDGGSTYLYKDTGVRIVTVIGMVPIEEDSIGPTTSEDVDATVLEMVLEDDDAAV
jgi:hypothetical protein